MGLTFKLKREDIPVTIEVEQGNNLNLRLVEMTSAQRDQYLDATCARMGFDAKGNAMGIRKFDGMHADLLTRCLVKEDNTTISLKELQTWPASVVTSLFEEAQKLNHLNQDKSVVPVEKKE